MFRYYLTYNIKSSKKISYFLSSQNQKKDNIEQVIIDYTDSNNPNSRTNSEKVASAFATYQIIINKRIAAYHNQSKVNKVSLLALTIQYVAMSTVIGEIDITKCKVGLSSKVFMISDPDKILIIDLHSNNIELKYLKDNKDVEIIDNSQSEELEKIIKNATYKSYTRAALTSIQGQVWLSQLSKKKIEHLKDIILERYKDTNYTAFSSKVGAYYGSNVVNKIKTNKINLKDIPNIFVMPENYTKIGFNYINKNPAISKNVIKDLILARERSEKLYYGLGTTSNVISSNNRVTLDYIFSYHIADNSNYYRFYTLVPLTQLELADANTYFFNLVHSENQLSHLDDEVKVLIKKYVQENLKSYKFKKYWEIKDGI